MREVLEDIHHFRSDIRLEDLLPRTYTIIFQKINTESAMDAEEFGKVHHDLMLGHRPDGNSVLKSIYRVYKKLHS
jgi:hypothetical protein